MLFNPKSRYIELRYSLLLVLRPAPSWKQNVAYIVPCHRWESRSIWLTNILRVACWRHSTTCERDCRPIPWWRKKTKKKRLSVVGQIHTHVIMERNNCCHTHRSISPVLFFGLLPPYTGCWPLVGRTLITPTRSDCSSRERKSHTARGSRVTGRRGLHLQKEFLSRQPSLVNPNKQPYMYDRAQMQKLSSLTY